MKIGQKCKINNDDRTYKVTDTRKENKTKKETENSIEYQIEYFVDLEEIGNSDNKKTNVSIVKVYPI